MRRQLYLNFDGKGHPPQFGGAAQKALGTIIENKSVPPRFRAHLARLMNVMSSIGWQNSELCAKLLGAPREVVEKVALGEFSEAYKLMLAEKAKDGGIAIKLASRIGVLAHIHEKLCVGDGEKTLKTLVIIDENNVPFTLKRIRSKSLGEACAKAARNESLAAMLTLARERLAVFENASELISRAYKMFENMGTGREARSAVQLFMNKTLPRMVVLTQGDKSGKAMLTLLGRVESDLKGGVKNITYHNYVVLLTDWLERAKALPTDEVGLSNAMKEVRRFVRIRNDQEKTRTNFPKGAPSGTHAPGKSSPPTWDDAIRLLESGQ